MSVLYRAKLLYKSVIFTTAALLSIILIGCSASPALDASDGTTTPTSFATLSTRDTNPATISAGITPAVSSSTPSSTAGISPYPTAIYTPKATPCKPTNQQLELMQYMLDLINKDRQTAGVSPVTLDFNAAAQMHAQNMLEYSYAAHWDTDGLKPYMRYTLEGGLNAEAENVAYSTGSENINVEQELQSLEHTMMFNDAESNWSHRDTILSKWQKKVNIGIAYDARSVALDQQFEGDYLEYFQPPTLSGNILSLSGRFTISDVKLDNISVSFDNLPHPISPSELRNNDKYHHYSLGSRLGIILPPPPPGQVYNNLPANGVIASKWNIDQSGRFSIRADISPILAKGKGVYTIVLVTIINNDPYNMTNYSIFIE